MSISIELFNNTISQNLTNTELKRVYKNLDYITLDKIDRAIDGLQKLINCKSKVPFIDFGICLNLETVVNKENLGYVNMYPVVYNFSSAAFKSSVSYPIPKPHTYNNRTYNMVDGCLVTHNNTKICGLWRGKQLQYRHLYMNWLITQLTNLKSLLTTNTST